MITVSKSFTFEASHMLPHHPGKCRRLHGHTFSVVVEIAGEIDPKTQMVLDYALIKEKVDPLIERFDHQHLNLFLVYPTAENIAVYLLRALFTVFKAELGARLGFVTVKVSETLKTWASISAASREDIPEHQGSLDVRFFEHDELFTKVDKLWVKEAEQVGKENESGS